MPGDEDLPRRPDPDHRDLVRREQARHLRPEHPRVGVRHAGRWRVSHLRVAGHGPFIGVHLRRHEAVPLDGHATLATSCRTALERRRQPLPLHRHHLDTRVPGAQELHMGPSRRRHTNPS